MPIYIGATGAKMMALTGEIADGVVFNYSGVAPVQRASHGAPGRGSGPGWAAPSTTWTDPQLIVCSMATGDSEAERTEALDGGRMLITQYLGQQPHIMKASGVSQSLLDEVGSVLTWPATLEQVEAASKLVARRGGAAALRGRHRRRVPGPRCATTSTTAAPPRSCTRSGRTPRG